MREVVDTDDAPDAVGAYSQATVLDGVIYTSGQIAIDPATGELITGDFEAEVRQVLSNLRAVVDGGGGHEESILKTTVYLTDLSHYETLNEIYQSFFSDPYPARSAVEVSSLPGGARVEIEVIAQVAS